MLNEHGRFLEIEDQAYPDIEGQVVLIQLAVAVESLWPLPGFGQFGGAVMLRTGMVITLSRSQAENG